MAIGQIKNSLRAQSSSDFTILNITCGVDLAIFETFEILEIIKRVIKSDDNIIFGCVIDKNYSDKLKLTVLVNSFIES